MARRQPLLGLQVGIDVRQPEEVRGSGGGRLVPAAAVGHAAAAVLQPALRCSERLAPVQPRVQPQRLLRRPRQAGEEVEHVRLESPAGLRAS